MQTDTKSITFPSVLTQGDSYTSTITLDDTSYALTLHFSGPTSFSLPTTQNEKEEYVINLLSSSSSTFIPGDYQVIFYVTKDDQRVVLKKTSLSVVPDFLTDTTTDFRTFNQKMVDALEALLLRRADNFQLDLLKSSIDAKEFERMSIDEIQNLLDLYKMKVQNEQRLSKGRSPWGRKISYNFPRNTSDFINTFDELNR